MKDCNEIQFWHKKKKDVTKKKQKEEETTMKATVEAKEAVKVKEKATTTTVVLKVKERTIEKRAENEATTKTFEEEKRKQDEEELNNDASPMDRNIVESSAKAPLIGGHPPISELRLPLFTHSKPRKMANLKSLWFYKATNIIVQQQTKNIPVDGRVLLSVIIETSVTKGVKKDPLFSKSTDIVFTLATEQNLKDFVHENKEKCD